MTTHNLKIITTKKLNSLKFIVAYTKTNLLQDLKWIISMFFLVFAKKH